MYLNEFDDLNAFNDLSQTWWEKIIQEVRTPIQRGIETAKQQARERITEGATRLVEQQGSKLWDRIFGKPQPVITPQPEITIQPTTIPDVQPKVFGLQPLHLGLIVAGSILLYNILRKK